MHCHPWGVILSLAVIRKYMRGSGLESQNPFPVQAFQTLNDFLGLTGQNNQNRGNKFNYRAKTIYFS
jgi:hypothetical protein